MIKLINLVKTYGTRNVLNCLSFRFPKNGLIGIVGPSGCGKTTLLNIMAGIDEPTSGVCLFKNRSLANMKPIEKSAYRLVEIGYVFQDFRLFDNESVHDNLALPLETMSNETKEIKKRHINHLLATVGLSTKAKNKINTLSGGEKQRVAIARSLVNNPSIILCDEPTGALDEENATSIMKILIRLSIRQLVIIVSHDEKLIKLYCDSMLRMLDGQITSFVQLSSHRDTSGNIIHNLVKTKKNGFILPLSVMIKRSLTIIKTRKKRLILNNTIMSLGLLGVGLSLIMAFSIQERIITSFSQVIDDNIIVMSNQSNANSISTAYSASFENVSKIKDKYSVYLKGIGVSYMVNFETFFQDRDELYISSTAYKIILPRFTTRQINDFCWLEGKDDEQVIHPKLSSVMSDDDLVIGLSYNEMIGLCYSLRIERNYFSLGEYINREQPLVTLGIANNDWQYDDEQVFHLVGVIETDEPRLFHTNYLWSEYVFEEKMRIPTIDSQEYEFPWQMAKTYFLSTIDRPEIFMEMTLYDRNLHDFVFERAGPDYHSSLCPISGPCFLNRLLVYHTDKNAVNISDVYSIIYKETNIENCIFASRGGYYYHPNSFIAGFARNTFVSFSKSQIEKATDADCLIDSENDNIELVPPPGVLQGSIQTSLNGGLGFSSNIKELIIGRIPESLSEIAVSQGLVDSLFLNEEVIGKTMQIAVNYNIRRYDNDRIEKQYSISEVTVVGITKSDKVRLHHHPYWTIGFFQLMAGMSAFELVPEHVLFTTSTNKNSDELIANLSSKYSKYQFYNPMKVISEGIDETMSFLQIALFSFASLAVLTSIFLFFLVMFVTIEENKKDISLMYYLGISRSDIRRSFIVCGLMMSSLAFILSSIEIIIVDYIVNHIVGGYVGTVVRYQFNPIPLIVILFVSIIIAYCSTCLAFNKLYSSKQNKQKMFKINYKKR